MKRIQAESRFYSGHYKRDPAPPLRLQHEQSRQVSPAATDVDYVWGPVPIYAACAHLKSVVARDVVATICSAGGLE